MQQHSYATHVYTVTAFTSTHPSPTCHTQLQDSLSMELYTRNAIRDRCVHAGMHGSGFSSA
jgi:hypothetical protein